MRKISLNSRGVSLIELVVVLGIIAILSAIAIPKYKGYVAKGRRAQSFVLLQDYFTTATAARAEFGVFPGNFVQTGFQPKGDLFYRFRADPGLTPINTPKRDDACFATWSTCNCGGACPNFKTWVDTIGAIGTQLGTFTVQVACGTLAAFHMADATFSVRTGGIIHLGATVPDRWGIDHNKDIQMCSDGIKN